MLALLFQLLAIKIFQHQTQLGASSKTQKLCLVVVILITPNNTTIIFYYYPE